MSKSVFSTKTTRKAPASEEVSGKLGTVTSQDVKEIDDNLSQTEKAYIEQRVRTRKIKFEPLVGQDGKFLTAAGGLNIGLIAMHKAGKSLGALLWGFFNSAYKDKMKPFTQKCLSTGILPEIRKIVVVDTECTLEDDSKRGMMGTLVAPLRPIIQFVKTPLQRKTEGFGDGKEKDKVVNLNMFDLDHQRQNVEAAIWEAVEDYDENTLIIFDSASDYKKALDDLSDVVFKKTVITTMKPEKGVAADAKEDKPFWRSFYQYRNKWWHNTLIKLRSSKAWVVSTIKLAETDDEFRAYEDPVTKEEKLKPQFYPLMCKRTEYRIDQGYVMRDWVDMNTGEYGHYLRFEWGKHEHHVPSFERIGGVENKEDQCFIPYAYKKRMAMMDILEDMAPCLLGEIDVKEEDLW